MLVISVFSLLFSSRHVDNINETHAPYERQNDLDLELLQLDMNTPKEREYFDLAKSTAIRGCNESILASR